MSLRCSGLLRTANTHTMLVERAKNTGRKARDRMEDYLKRSYE